MKIFYNILFLTIFLQPFIGCKKYLDAKTDKQLVVPVTLQDAQALLDYYTAMNTNYPSIGGVSDDDFYLSDTYYNSISNVYQNNYTWSKDSYNNNEWNNMYAIILYSNFALETVKNINPDSTNIADWQRIKGSALFFRAYALYHAAQYYAEPYDKNTAAQKPGEPIRLTSSVTEKIERGTLAQTYEKIIEDMKSAVVLLPVNNPPVSRPSKIAAYAALARIYLTMEDYSNAGKYADSCLSIYSTLLNYNSIDPVAAIPFSRFNSEVIFQSTVLVAGPLSTANWRVDSLLYASYSANDLRKILFFKLNGTAPGNYYGFKGNYESSSSGNVFNGLATDEIYLIRAECNARQNNKDAALADLNTLLIKRWKTGTFVPYTATTPDDALVKILTERRKELVCRALRWFDLRRLNKDNRFAKTLVRLIGGQLFQLPPNDLRYTQYIPQNVIDLTGIQQNTR